MKKIDELIKKFDEFESKLNFKKFPKIPVLKLSFGLITISTLTFIIFRPQINKYLSQEGSNISKNIIESPQLQVSIQNELVRLINDHRRMLHHRLALQLELPQAARLALPQAEHRLVRRVSRAHQRIVLQVAG